MRRGDLTDAEWERLRPFLPVSNRRCGRWRDHRQMIDGILHRVRTGVQWRDLPERFGPWNTVYERHRLWPAGGGPLSRPVDRIGGLGPAEDTGRGPVLRVGAVLHHAPAPVRRHSPARPTPAACAPASTPDRRSRPSAPVPGVRRPPRLPVPGRHRKGTDMAPAGPLAALRSIYPPELLAPYAFLSAERPVRTADSDQIGESTGCHTGRPRGIGRRSARPSHVPVCCPIGEPPDQ